MPYLGNVPAEAYSSVVKDSFNGDGSTTAFTMSQPSTTNNVRVVVENVIQDPTVAYTCSGTTLTFTSAPPTGTANIYVVHLGPAVQTAVPPSEITNATTYTSDLTVQGAFTSQGIDDNADATAITIDSSENVYIGTTTDFPGASNTAEGTQIRNDGRSLFSNSSDWVVNINRNTSDGDIALFRKDGSTVGSIGTVASEVYIGNGDTGLYFASGNNDIRPFNTSTQNSVDNSIDLGRSATRFKDLYLSGGVYLGGTGSANKLDDYEFGSWSPFWSNNTGSAIFNASPTINMARYEKVGNMVTVWTYFNMGSGFGTTGAYSASGNLCVGGLPFTANGDGSGGTAHYYAGTVGWYASWNNFDSSSNGYGPMVYTRTGTTTLQMVYPSFNAIADITQNFVNSNNSGIILSVTYQTAS